MSLSLNEDRKPGLPSAFSTYNAHLAELFYNKEIRKLHGLEAFNYGQNSHLLFGDDSNKKMWGNV